MSGFTPPQPSRRRNIRNLTLPNTSTRTADPPDGQSQVPGGPGNLDGNRNDTLEIGLEFELDLRSEDLIVLKELGAGNGGTVSKVKHASTNVVMARKIIRVDAQENVRRQIVRELQVGHDCSSPYVITFYGAFQNDARDIVLCMEYMDCGSLDRISKDFGPIRVNVLGKITESILGGLVYLYEAHRIMHRDIKPSNVLVNSRGSIKLCDFGVATETVNSVANTFVGTSTYMAPERIQAGGPYSVTSDVWSVGLTVIELAIGKFPFDSSDSVAGNRASAGPMGIVDLLQTIVHEPAPRLPQSDVFPVILHDFVGKCLLKSPEERPTPRQLYDNDLFLQAAKRTPVNLAEWAVSMMERHNRRSYLAPPAPRALNRDGSRDSVIIPPPSLHQPPTPGGESSHHDPTTSNSNTITAATANANADAAAAASASTAAAAAASAPDSGSSGDPNSNTTTPTPTSTDLPVISTQQTFRNGMTNGIAARSAPPPLSLEHLSLETRGENGQPQTSALSAQGSGKRQGFEPLSTTQEPVSAIEPARRPEFPPRTHSAGGPQSGGLSNANTTYVPPNGLQSATMPRRTMAPPPRDPPTRPLPRPPGTPAAESLSAGFGSPQRQR